MALPFARTVFCMEYISPMGFRWLFHEGESPRWICKGRIKRL